jgi:hypothetical protein
MLFVGLLGGETPQGLQGGDGGHQEGLVARPLLAAGDGAGRGAGFVAVLVFFGGDQFGDERPLPALHGLAEDRGALTLRERVLLPCGGAGPAFFDLAEVAADDPVVHAQFVGDLEGGEALEEQPFEGGEELSLLGGGLVEFFFVGDFVHFLRNNKGFRGSRAA